VQTIMLESGAVALEGGADALGLLQLLLQSDLRVALSPDRARRVPRLDG